MGKEPLHGRRDHRQDAWRHRLRQCRRECRRTRARAEDARHRLRSLSLRGARRRRSASKKSSSTSFLARADFITLHTPLTAQTRNILSAENLAKTRKGRAHHQLRARRPCRRSGAAQGARRRPCRRRRLRRVCARSRRPSNPLFGHPHVVCTPHLGASTREAQEKVALQIAEQMSDYFTRGAIANAVNFPSISAEEAPRLKPFVELAEKLGLFVGQVAARRRRQNCRSSMKAPSRSKRRRPITAAAISRACFDPFSKTSIRCRRRSSPRSAAWSIEEVTREAQGDYEFARHAQRAYRAGRNLRFGNGVPRRQAAHRAASATLALTPNSRRR